MLETIERIITIAPGMLFGLGMGLIFIGLVAAWISNERRKGQ